MSKKPSLSQAQKPTIAEAITDLCGKNKEAAKICERIITKAPRIHPVSFGNRLRGKDMLERLDLLDIRGYKIVIFYEELCDRHMPLAFALLYFCVLSESTHRPRSLFGHYTLSKDELLKAIKKRSGKDINMLLVVNEVQAIFPEFRTTEHPIDRNEDELVRIADYLDEAKLRRDILVG